MSSVVWRPPLVVWRCWVFAVIALILTTVALGKPTPQVGITEQLGEKIPAGEMTFTDEAGQPIRLDSLFGDKPVVLTLVYFGCPGICTPLLNELSRAADAADARPGADYRLVTISFNPHDTATVAKAKRANLLATMRRTQPAPDAWRFLVGDPDNIRRITEATGFHYLTSPNGQDFTHAATVIVLSRDGRIVRYLNGLSFTAAELDLALADAKTNRPRSFIQAVAQLCYARDESGRMQLAVDRIVLGITGLLAVTFAFYAWSQGRRRKRRLARAAGAEGQGRP